MEKRTCELPFITQKPRCRSSFSVIPLPECWTFSWHHRMIILVIALLFGSRTGCFSSNDSVEFFNLPPTRIIPSISRNGSRRWILLVFFRGLNLSVDLSKEFDRTSSSFLKLLLWRSRMMTLSACFNASTFCLDFLDQDSMIATTFFMRNHLEILFSSTVRISSSNKMV